MRAGLVNLEFRPTSQTVAVGATVFVGVYAVPADGLDQSVGLVGVGLTWDSTALTLVGHDEVGAVSWATAGFPSVGGGVNDSLLDGEAYFQAVIAFGGLPVTATPAGILVTTLQFTALPSSSGLTAINMVACVRSICTTVLDNHPLAAGVTDVTGSLGSAESVTVTCASPTDCDDANICTDDSCDLNNNCAHVANDANDPGDGLFCNGFEVCVAGATEIQGGSVPDCDDLLTCTTDGCDETLQACTNDLQAAFCLIAGECHAEGAPRPGNECEACLSTMDAQAWSLVPPGASCGDPSDTECDGADTCDGLGVCQQNVAPIDSPCGDGATTDCTVPDTCDGAGVCLTNDAPDGSMCDDALFCTLGDQCAAGVCVGTSNFCTGQTCDEVTQRCKAVDVAVAQSGTVAVGDVVNVSLIVSSGAGQDESVGAISAIVVWDATKLELLGNVDDGPFAWFLSGFLDDSGLDGLNDTFLDGNARYEASAPPVPALVNVQGLLVTTLQFRALSVGVGTVGLIEQFGTFSATRVLDGETVGLDITGLIMPSIPIDVVECLADAHCDDGEFCNGPERCVAQLCTAGTPPECDDGLFCTGTEVCTFGVGCVSSGNPCPDAASCDDASVSCGGCVAPDASGVGCRYLAITPAPGVETVALSVVGDPSDPSVDCVIGFVQSDGTVGVGAVFLTPAQWGTVMVTGDGFRPNSAYHVRADCTAGGTGFVSSLSVATTWVWGDVTGDGFAQFDDVAAVFDASQGNAPPGSLPNQFDLVGCVPDGIIDDADVLAVQSAVVGDPFPCASVCTLCVPADAVLPEPNGVAKNRFITIGGTNPGRDTAIRVTFVDLPAPFDVWNGLSLWVGTPRLISERGGTADPTPEFESFYGALLSCDPVWADWSAFPDLHVFHEAIVPGASYQVDVLGEFCDPLTVADLSPGLMVSTALWADITSTFDLNTQSWGAPDNVVNVTSDVVAMIAKFVSDPTAPKKVRVDLDPAVPDGVISVVEIALAVDAFRGLPFPYEPTAVPCP